MEGAKARINELAAQIVGYDPVVLMRRGWSITYGTDGKVLKSVEGLDTRTEITTRLADGTLVSTITNIATTTSTKQSAKESKHGSQK
jgi:exonuclease VII large subunit